MRRALLLVIGLLPLASTLAAQVVPSSYKYINHGFSAALYSGYLSGDKGLGGIGLHASPVLGGEFTARLGSGPISGLVDVGLVPAKRTIATRAKTTDTSLTVLGDVNAPIVSAEGGIRFQFTGGRTWHDLAPYVGATGGVFTFLNGRPALEDSIPQDQRLDLGPALAVTVSAGTDWFLSQGVSLRLVARHDLWRLNLPTGLALSSSREWLKSYGGTLGLAVHF